LTRIVEIAGRSETGPVRETNEDCCLVIDLDERLELPLGELCRAEGQRGPLLVICDGMGGEAGGEVASSLACATIRQVVQDCPETSHRAVLARNLRAAVRQANLEVCAAAAADKSLRGMGTTVSAAAIVGNTAVLAQVGDSRAYVLRGNRLTQITRDQSVVSALVQAGQLSEERAPYSMQRGRVLQALGHAADVDVSLSIAELRWGDRLLLSSDGLHDFVSHEAMTSACGIETLEGAAEALVALAMKAGGADNISVLLAELRGDELAKAMPGDDELRFTELDPSLEGEMALSTTSMVARRLAHKAGLRKDGWPLAIPATSQHPVVTGNSEEGAAQRAYSAGGKMSLVAWVCIACVAIAAVFFALTWL
jgi:protein phosphatase